MPSRENVTAEMLKLIECLPENDTTELSEALIFELISEALKEESLSHKAKLARNASELPYDLCREMNLEDSQRVLAGRFGRDTHTDGELLTLIAKRTGISPISNSLLRELARAICLSDNTDLFQKASAALAKNQIDRMYGDLPLVILYAPSV